MHTSAGAACGRDDDDDPRDLCACSPLRNTKIKETRRQVNEDSSVVEAVRQVLGREQSRLHQRIDVAICAAHINGVPGCDGGRKYSPDG